MGKIGPPHVFAHQAFNFHPIFKCDTILESWRVDYCAAGLKKFQKFLTHEKNAFENEQFWLLKLIDVHLQLKKCFYKKVSFLKIF